MIARTGRLCDRQGCPGDNHPPALPTGSNAAAAISAAQQASESAASDHRHPLMNYRQQINDQIGDLAEMFDQSGHSFYLVGGMVRDGALGLPLDHDIDVTTDARPEEIKPILEAWGNQVWDQGARFGTIAARRGDADVEITTFRSETYRPDSRKPDVRFSDNVEVDLSRRDFTINSVAVSLPSWEVVDPFGGLHDLQERRLRTPSDPDELFRDDPLRLLRAARFSARFQLTPDAEVTDAIRRNRDRIQIVSSERIGDEISKMLALRRPSRGLDYLHETGTLNAFLAGLGQPPTEPIGSFDILDEEPAPRWAALFGRNLGAAGTADLMRNHLSVDRSVTTDTEQILKSVESIRQLGADPTDAACRRFVGQHRDHYWKPALDVMNAWGQWPGEQLVHNLVHIEDHHGDALRILPVDGNQVSELVGGEGPLVGKALNHIREHQYEHGEISAEQAVRLVQDMTNEKRS